MGTGLLIGEIKCAFHKDILWRYESQFFFSSYADLLKNITMKIIFLIGDGIKSCCGLIKI